MNPSIQFLKDNSHRFCQFEESELQPVISRITGLSHADAVTAGTFHCNMLSKWLNLRAQNIIDYDYEIFFERKKRNPTKP